MDSVPSTSASGHCEEEMGSDDVFDMKSKSAPPRSSNPAPSDVDVGEEPLRDEEYAVGIFTSHGLIKPEQMPPTAVIPTPIRTPFQQQNFPPQAGGPSASYRGTSNFLVPNADSFPAPTYGSSVQVGYSSARQCPTASSFHFPNVSITSSSIGFNQQNYITHQQQVPQANFNTQVGHQPGVIYSTAGTTGVGQSMTNLQNFNHPVGENAGVCLPQFDSSTMASGHPRPYGPQAPYCLPQHNNPYQAGCPVRHPLGLGYMGFNPLPFGFDWRPPQRPLPHPESPVTKMRRLVADSTGPEFERRIASTFTMQPPGYGGPAANNVIVAHDMEEFGGAKEKGKGRGKSRSKSKQFHESRPSLVFSATASKRDQSTR